MKEEDTHDVNKDHKNVNKRRQSIKYKNLKMNQIKIENEKRTLLSDLINATRDVTSKFGGSKKLVTEEEAEIKNLIICWEKVISCGIKSSLLNNVQELFNASSNGNMFWTFASKFLSPDEHKRFNDFKNLWTDRGRTKALIRNALNEGCLERYILTWINAENLADFYEPHALIRDEKAEILSKLAADISNILFAIAIDIPELNVSSFNKQPIVMVEPVIESGIRASISKPKKINQIDDFEESNLRKKQSEAAALNIITKPSDEQMPVLCYTEPSVDRCSISTESSSMSHSNFYDAKDDDTISHSSTSSGDDEVINNDISTTNKESESKCDAASHQIEYESTIKIQRDRIMELEQQNLDLTLENTRLRQLLNANKVNTAANFQVSIPRAVLKKSKTKNYYLYEINLKTTCGSENWTIFKRYRDFYKLHKDLKKQHIQIKVLDFPPKKKIGNMDFDFVEDRRQRLQVYIRHVLQNLPELHVETRQLLEAKCSFFKT